MGAQSSSDVLLVDDDDSVRRSLARLLRAHDFRVLEAENTDVALRILATTRPGILLMDLVMPGASPLEVIRRLKEDPDTASLPIVALTASPPAAATDRALFAAIVTKPCQRQSLLEALERVR